MGLIAGLPVVAVRPTRLKTTVYLRREIVAAPGRDPEFRTIGTDGIISPLRSCPSDAVAPLNIQGKIKIGLKFYVAQERYLYALRGAEIVIGCNRYARIVGDATGTRLIVPTLLSALVNSDA